MRPHRIAANLPPVLVAHIVVYLDGKAAALTTLASIKAVASGRAHVKQVPAHGVVKVAGPSKQLQVPVEDRLASLRHADTPDPRPVGRPTMVTSGDVHDLRLHSAHHRAGPPVRTRSVLSKATPSPLRRCVACACLGLDRPLLYMPASFG